MSVADDYGRFYGNPRTILGACWPTAHASKVRERDVASWLEECSTGDRPLIILYEVDGAQFLEIQGFGQQIRSKSKFPNCLAFASNCLADASQMLSTSRSRSRNSESESESKSESNTHTPQNPAALQESFAKFWQAYPNKLSKGQAERAWKKLAPKPELVAMMLAALGEQIAEREAKTAARLWVPEWKLPATWLRGRCWEDEASVRVRADVPASPPQPVCASCGFTRTLHERIENGKTLAETHGISGVCLEFQIAKAADAGA